MKTPPLIPALLATMALAGCASPTTHATFVTKTSLALIDADTAPAGISIAYDRVEGYIGPRLEDGSVLPVTGYIDTDGGILVRKIRQVYATGKAAEYVTAHTAANAAPAASAPAAPASAPELPSRQVLFFGTGTNIGLKIGFEAGTVVPNSFNFGFRRKEISVIPVDRGTLPSVFASIDNSAAAHEAEGTKPAVEFGLNQFFATGPAAERLAQDPNIGGVIARRLNKEAEFRSNESRQAKDALDTLYCLSRVPDDRLDRVWNNAEDLGLFDTGATEKTLERIRARPVGDRLGQRQIYTGDLGKINAASAEFGARMRTHREVVCKLVPQA